MKIGNQQLCDIKRCSNIWAGRNSVRRCFYNKNTKDTVSFSGNSPENSIPDDINKIDINTNDGIREITENADGSRTITLKKCKKMLISNKEINLPTELTTVKEDSKGIRTEAEIIKISEKFPHEYDIYSYSPNEKPIQTSTAIKTENGDMISRIITSADNFNRSSLIRKTNGNKVEFKFKPKVFGSNSSEIVRTFEKIDDTHTKSTFNDVIYETEFLPDKIVTKKTGPYGMGPKFIELDFNQLDPKLTDLYKQLPGDFFCALKDTGTKVLLGHRAEQNNACYYDGDNTISMSEELKNNTYAFAHELGHATDYRKKRYYMDPSVCKDFKHELMYFKNNANKTEKEVMNYFTGSEDSLQNILSEIAAETNAIISGLKNTSEIYMLRDIVLQKYFPKTAENISRHTKITL